MGWVDLERPKPRYSLLAIIPACMLVSDTRDIVLTEMQVLQDFLD